MVSKELDKQVQNSLKKYSRLDTKTNRRVLAEWAKKGFKKNLTKIVQDVTSYKKLHKAERWSEAALKKEEVMLTAIEVANNIGLTNEASMIWLKQMIEQTMKDNNPQAFAKLMDMLFKVKGTYDEGRTFRPDTPLGQLKGKDFIQYVKNQLNVQLGDEVESSNE